MSSGRYFPARLRRCGLVWRDCGPTVTGSTASRWTGVRDQDDVNFITAARDVLAGRAHVVLHIAGAENAARIDIFESGKNFFRIAFGDVAITLKSGPRWLMPINQFCGAEPGTGVEKFVDQRD